MNKIERFRGITETMCDTYERKNNDYGDSFGESVRKYGMISALTRISDKFNRLESLILKGDQKVKDESIKDTLLDLACYSIMTIIELSEGAETKAVASEEIKELKNALYENKLLYEDEIESLEKKLEEKDKHIELYLKDLQALKNQLDIERERNREESQWKDFVMY